MRRISAKLNAISENPLIRVNELDCGVQAASNTSVAP